MKITFLCPVVSQGGGSRVVAIHALNLLKRGHDVTVVSRAPSPPSWSRRLKDALRGRPPFSVDPNHTLFFDPLGERHRIVSADRPFAPEDLPDADILIATWWETAFDVDRMPSEKGKKVYFVQHHEVHDHLPPHSAETYRLPLRKIAVSGWLVDVMEKIYGDSDVSNVPNAIDNALFDAPARKRQDLPTLGFVYTPVPYKGVNNALAAIEIVRNTYSDLRVMAFGRRPPSPDLPLPEDTVYHASPPQTDIVKIYSACDVWVVPSHSEGFGLPILEAMACRTPVVSTRVGAATDLIEPGVTGYLSDPGDPAGLADGIERALALRPDDWAAMSLAAHARAHSYTWDDATDLFEAALADLAA